MLLVHSAVLAESVSPLNAAWEAYRQAAATLSPDEIVEAARAVGEATRQSDALQAPELSLVMLRDAEAFRTRGDTGLGIRLAQVAADLSPALVAPHVWLAQAWLSGPDPDVMASAAAWAAAWKASMSGFWSLLYRIDRVIVAAVLAMVSAAVLFVAWLLIRTIPLLGHLLMEWSGRRMFRPTAWLLAAAVLLAPIASARWGWWLVLTPAAVAWWFLSKRERLTLTILAALGIVVSFVLPYAVPALTADHSGEMRLVVDVVEGRASTVDASVVVDSPQGASARGTALVRAGRTDEAATLFEEAFIRWPADPRVLTGYGNVLFHRHEYGRAIELYRAALNVAPQSIPVLYNLSQAYRANLRFDEGEAAFQEARALDASLLDRYADRSRRGETFLVADYPTTHGELLVQAFEPRTMPPTLQDAVARLSGHLSPLLTVGVLALFGACWVVGRWVTNQPASPCAACGTAVCRHCQRYFLDLKLCSSCWKTHAKGAKFTNQATLPQVVRHWAIRRRIAALLSIIPGLGHFSVARPLWGLAFALAGWGIFWSGVLREIGWMTMDIRLVPLPWYTTWIPLGAGLAVLVVVAARHLLRLEWSQAESTLPPERM